MKNVIGTRKLGFLFTLILGASSAACGEDEGSGGSSSNTGGAATTGGGPATGGLGTTGGVVTTGGAPTTGGVPTTGGAPGTGGVTPTTGGALTTGGAPATGGAASGGEPPMTIDDYAVEEGGFVRTCGMTGYAWVDAGPATANNDTGVLSTIAPDSFSTVAAGEVLCASGIVAADDDYGGYAMIGVNIGQEASLVAGEETPNVNITPTGTGITVSVTNNAGGALRVQIQDNLGGTDAAHRWCADLPSSGQGTIEWTEFNTECWAPAGGTYYAGEPLNAVLVLVPGKQSTDTAFDFCLNGFTQAGTTDCGTPGTGGAGGAGPGTGGAGGAGPVTGGAGGIDVGGAGPAGAPAVAGAAGSPVVVAGAASVAGAGGANGGATAAAGSPAAGQVSGG